MRETERTCPECGMRFPTSELVCPLHNTPLVDAASVTGAPPQRRGWPVGVVWLTVSGIVVVVALLAANFRHLNPSNEFRLYIRFEDGEGLDLGDKVIIHDNNSGKIVAARFVEKSFVAEVVVRPDAAIFLTSNTVFYPARESYPNGRKCIVVWTPADEPGEPLQSGETVAAKPFLGAHRWQQMKEFIERFIAQRSK